MAITGLGFWLVASSVNLGEHGGLSIAGGMARFALSLIGSLFLFFSFLGIEAARVPGWLVYLGKISYGLYVYHYIVLNAFSFNHFTDWLELLGLRHVHVVTHAALSFVLTLILAHASYRWYEAPFLRMKKRFEWVSSRIV